MLCVFTKAFRLDGSLEHLNICLNWWLNDYNFMFNKAKSTDSFIPLCFREKTKSQNINPYTQVHLWYQTDHN